jgi:hypothetical protein
MIDGKASSPTESVSRMLGWGRILLVSGGVLLFLAFGSQFAAPTRLAAGQAGVLLWCGGIAAGVGAIFTALGAVEQRLVETRALMLTAIELLKAAEPDEQRFRSRPAVKSFARTSPRQKRVG